MLTRELCWPLVLLWFNKRAELLSLKVTPSDPQSLSEIQNQMCYNRDKLYFLQM